MKVLFAVSSPKLRKDLEKALVGLVPEASQVWVLTSRAAVEAMKDEAFDLVLAMSLLTHSDPGSNLMDSLGGRDVVRAIRAGGLLTKTTCPVLLLSRRDDSPFIGPFGALEVLPLGISVEEIVEKVASHLP
jgi:hypothetical protein